MKAEILNVDYNEYVSMLGTAHFTRRSLQEACEFVRTLKPSDLALELDLERFQFLNRQCVHCQNRSFCAGRCEFVEAADALGNVNANIWLIDMSEREIGSRVQQLQTSSKLRWLSLTSFPFWSPGVNEVELWEKGYKDEVLDRHTRRLEALRTNAPHVWRVLIEERNTLMAARLAWIATRKLKEEEFIKILALTGAAHVKGMKELLSAPTRIGEELRRLRLTFTLPTLIRRLAVN